MTNQTFDIKSYTVGKDTLYNIVSVTHAINKQPDTLLKFIGRHKTDYIPTNIQEEGNPRIERAVTLDIAIAYWRHSANKGNATAKKVLKAFEM